MAKKIQLTKNEAFILTRLTTRAKMDWFDVNEDLQCIDRDNHNRVISTRNAVKTIVEGLTDYDVMILEDDEIVIMFNLLNRL